HRVGEGQRHRGTLYKSPGNGAGFVISVQQARRTHTHGGTDMATPPARALEDCLIELFQTLGIGRAHLAAGQLVPSDWVGLAGRYPDSIASLTLVSPRLLRPELRALGSRLLVLASDQGPGAAG